MISLSNFRNKVYVKKATVTTDAVGNQIHTFQDYCTRWAEVKVISQSKEIESGSEIMREALTFTVRYDSVTKLITPVIYRAIFQGKTYDITAVENVKMRNETLEITAERKK